MAAETHPRSHDAQLYEFDPSHAGRFGVTSFEILQQEQSATNFYRFEAAELELADIEIVPDRLYEKVGQAAVNGLDGTLAEVFYGLGARQTRLAPRVGDLALAA